MMESKLSEIEREYPPLDRSPLIATIDEWKKPFKAGKHLDRVSEEIKTKLKRDPQKIAKDRVA